MHVICESLSELVSPSLDGTLEMSVFCQELGGARLGLLLGLSCMMCVNESSSVDRAE